MLVPETAVEPREVTEADDGDLFLTVLDEALAAVRGAGVPFLLIGGIGSAVYGRDRSTRDIDLFVRKMERLYVLLHESSKRTKRQGALTMDLSFLHEGGRR